MERKLRKGFCKIPNFIAWSDLSGSALKLYVFLASLSPKFRTIRNVKLRRLGMSINTLQRAKKELIKRKVLVVIERDGGANTYQLQTPNPTHFLVDTILRKLWVVGLDSRHSGTIKTGWEHGH